MFLRDGKSKLDLCNDLRLCLNGKAILLFERSETKEKVGTLSISVFLLQSFNAIYKRNTQMSWICLKCFLKIEIYKYCLDFNRKYFTILKFP